MASSFISYGSTVITSPPQPQLQTSPTKNKLSNISILFATSMVSSNANALFCKRRQRRRGDAVVVKAGPPSTMSLVVAFVLPLSLIAGTVFASIRIADQLDERFLEDLTMNQAKMEEKEAIQGGEDATAAEEEELEEKKQKVAAVPRVRNRPRREA